MEPPCEDNRECVDVEGAKGKRRILVEVELPGTAPVINVVKIWKWLGKRSAYRGNQVVVLQAFSAFFKNQPSFRRQNALYLGSEMARRFRNRKVTYIPLDFPFRPMKKRTSVTIKKGGGAMRKAATRLANRIAQQVMKASQLRRAAFQ